MHCLYFICERKFYPRTRVKIMRPWISTVRELTSENDENDKTALGLDQQNNNFISALHFCKYFFVVILQRYHDMKVKLPYILRVEEWGHERNTEIFFFFFEFTL